MFFSSYLFRASVGLVLEILFSYEVRTNLPSPFLDFHSGICTKRAFARPRTNLNLNIPKELWTKIDDHLKKRIDVICKEICADERRKQPSLA